MLRELAQRAEFQQITLPEWERAGVEVVLWRLDRLDAVGSGNKLFKLAENLRAARAAGYSRLLSFGGVFSNHIHALALQGAAQGFDTIGVIRGEPEAAANPTLRDAVAAGMQLHFVDRDNYRDAHHAGLRRDTLIAELQQRFGPCYIIPEGGANRLGASGCRVLGEIIAIHAHRFDTVVLPCGTGATLAGIVAGLRDRVPVSGVSVLKGGEFLRANVRDYLCELAADDCVLWAINLEHHGGGYARVPAALEQFVGRFQAATGIPIEPIYTGKMLYAIDRRIELGEFARGTRVLAIHTGGLQGARGFSYRHTTKQQAAIDAG